MKKILSIAFIILSSFSFGQEQMTRILFILDASNSMNARWGAQTRIDAAKELLAKTVDDIHDIPNLEIGLRVYGHQSPITATYQDCNDTKLEVPFGKDNFGQVKALIDDCIFAGIDALVSDYCKEHDTDIRTKADFEACLDKVRADINDKVLNIAKQVEQGLTLAHQCQKLMKGNVPLNMVNALGDCKGHLSSLVFPGFASYIGEARLDDWNRYIKGLARRLEKLPIDPHKDRQHQLTIEKCVNELSLIHI